MATAERLLDFRPLPDLRSDRRLVRAAQTGRSDAASALIERYYPKVRSFVGHLTNGAGNSEDLTQEVFARALGALGRFNGNYRFGPWLYRIAKNLCIDESRRAPFRPQPSDPADLLATESPRAQVDSVWERVSSHLASSIVRRALQSLGARQRMVLILKEMQGMSYAEIAEIVGTNERGVEGTLRRARANFRLAVARAEESEHTRASCARALRSLADGAGNTSEVRKHLLVCRECRSKAASISSADRLLGMLPPIATTAPAWKLQVASQILARRGPRRSLLSFLRGHPSMGFASPLAELVQAVVTFTVATSMSISAVSATTTIAAVAGAPPPATASPDADPATGRGPAVDSPSPSRANVAPESEAPSWMDDLLAIDPGLGLGLATLDVSITGLAATASAAVNLPPGPKLPVRSRPGPDSLFAVVPSPAALPRRRPRS